MPTVIAQNPSLFDAKSETDQVAVPEFPWMTVTRLDFGESFSFNDINKPLVDWVMEQVIATTKSYGLVTNSFYELEPVYADYWNANSAPKSWSVGPFCLTEEIVEQNGFLSTEEKVKPWWMVWLDEKLRVGSWVLYVAFGSQAEISVEQMEEIKIGLERSDANFLWVVRGKKGGFGDGFEERVKGRGVVVGEWVNQREILEHESVKGFVSHCGWNSVLESVCGGVPMVAWPLMAEQPLNAKFVVEEVGIGVRVETCNGRLDGFVGWEVLEKRVREVMEGEKGKEMRRKVEELREAAVAAVEEGGSSWRSMNEMIEELQGKQVNQLA
ncbi:hypothetical protein OSB04_027064 [Centaurea solstitialis]|uniref:UDP-glycosyltransferases domain-containing protein n=1 Tax=Centaurea solstitialis TaxID=347529 RepID=A0AA38SKI5_9ASTR|nr:hypothetical protein OSB04_027064 [Centaurea solstitialis]